MGRKKRMRTICSDDDYLSQQGGFDSHAQTNDPLPIESEEPSEGVEVLFEDNQGNRTRGKTLLAHLWMLTGGNRVVVDANDLHQPIGAEAGLLGQFLGTIARNGRICSLSHKNWFFLIKVAKKNILSVVKAKFIYSYVLEKWILKSLNNKWSQYKSNLKSMYFEENVPREELCKNVPEGVIEDQWISLVHYWYSPEAKAVSVRNRRARAMQKNPHTSGSKSFARCAYEMKMKDPKKRDPNRANVYLVTHKRKDGTFMNEEVAQAIQKCIGEQSHFATDSGGRISWEKDALSQVLGKDKNGRLRGVGLLPTSKNIVEPSRHFRGMEITTMDENMSVVLVRRLLEQVEKLNGRVEELSTEINQLKSGSVETSNVSLNEDTTPSTALAQNHQGGFLGLLRSDGVADWTIL